MNIKILFHKYLKKFHWNIRFWIILKYLISIPLKFLIWNSIEILNLKFHWMFLYQIVKILISSLSFISKSWTISTFSFPTAICNAVAWIINYDFIKNLKKLHWNNRFCIIFKHWILDYIEILDFKLYWNSGFIISLKHWIKNSMEI